MKHPTTEEDWFAYLDNVNSEAEHPLIAAHVESCAECQEAVELMRSVDRTLLAAAAALRANVLLKSAAISAAKASALSRLGNQSLSMRLGSLYLLLAPMCGVQTSTRAICAAAQRVSADSPRLLEERAWPGFVEHLHAIVAALCGEPAAQLVRERALSVQREAA